MKTRNLVLLPGLDGTGTLFDPLIVAMSRMFDIHVARYPANRSLSGDELLPYVEEIVPADRFILVAESFSSPLAVRFAARHQLNPVALIMCAGFVISPLGEWSYWAKVLANSLLFRVPLPDMLLEKFLVGPSAPATLKTAVRSALRLVHPSVLARRVRDVLECDVREDLRKTKVPILYIQGESDRLVRADCYQEIQRLRPDTILATIPAPHLVLQREPQRAATLIEEFIDGI